MPVHLDRHPVIGVETALDEAFAGDEVSFDVGEGPVITRQRLPVDDDLDFEDVREGVASVRTVGREPDSNGVRPYLDIEPLGAIVAAIDLRHVDREGPVRDCVVHDQLDLSGTEAVVRERLAVREIRPVPSPLAIPAAPIPPMPASRRRRLISLGRPAPSSPRVMRIPVGVERTVSARSVGRLERVPLGAAVVRGELHVEVDGAALSGVAALRFELPRESSDQRRSSVVRQPFPRSLGLSSTPVASAEPSSDARVPDAIGSP